LLKEIIDQLDLSVTTLLVFSDHGQIDQGGHGGHDAITLKEPFVAAGKGIKSGVFDAIQMVDIAPTVAILLGTSLPSSAEGKPLIDMLTLTSDQIRVIESIFTIQQQQLIKAYQTALMPALPDQDQSFLMDSQTAIIVMQNRYIQSGRLVRSLIVGLILGLCGFYIYKKRDTNILWIMVGTSTYLAAFNIKYSLLDNSPYSFSIISEPLQFILGIAGNTLLAFLIGTVIFGFKVKILYEIPTRILSQMFCYTGITMLLAALPAFYFIILYGKLIGPILPDIGLLFLCMLALVQVMVIGLTGLVFMGSIMGAAGIIRHYRKSTFWN
jgi:hypothetical protein